MTQAANPEVFATSEWLMAVSSLVLLWLTPLFVFGYPDQALKKQCWLIGMDHDHYLRPWQKKKSWSRNRYRDRDEQQREWMRWPQCPFFPTSASSHRPTPGKLTGDDERRPDESRSETGRIRLAYAPGPMMHVIRY
ncbi:hypothetical protein CORC01_02515 [Colletotrichum orchidophilum]|uniref:Uncharacterized protein n=1 Tax=Colletotrichum orchidophilum TaxID=1209926 RepID=A0A1G4BLM6_9PEZI|nr:uncharacterized protein CORC01_02515 [Colletotrichum orchidophilum]OHF02235.1 hypothetical protein CORC01_02515 [Colletotrichum orchidophilum]